MDWPHDPDGEQGSEGRRKYGLAIFAKKLDDLAFPTTRAASLEAFGGHPIRIDHETVVAATEVLDGLDDGPFEDRRALRAGLGDAMREQGYWAFESDRYQRD